MKIQDIKTPGFLTEPRLMGEQNDDGIGKIHYSSDLVAEGSKAGYYFIGSDLYHYDENSNKWFKYDEESKKYTSSSAPSRK